MENSGTGSGGPRTNQRRRYNARNSNVKLSANEKRAAREQRSDWSKIEQEGGSDAIVKIKNLLQELSQHVVERACFISSQRKFTVERAVELSA